MHKRIQNSLFFIGILLALVLVWWGWMWYRMVHEPLPIQSVVTFKVKPNMVINGLAEQLSEKKIIQNPLLFAWYAKLRGDHHRLRFGEFEVTPGMTAADVLHNITHGKGLVKHNVRLIEGWNFRQIKDYLAQDKNLRHVLKGKSDAEIMLLIGAKHDYPEGLFFPDTYTFTWGNTDLDVLKHAYTKMQQVTQDAWQHRAKGLPYRNSYQALIVASMIEKETAVDSERPRIAGVILLRLKKWMPLQIDPTVNYGLGKPFDYVLTRQDLHKKTPYNTYRRYGLPPTPIAMPSKASIIAALHPVHSNALYYVARGDGTHIFSSNYEQHKSAVRRYYALKEEHHTPSYLLKILPHYLKRSPLTQFASYILCFECI